MRGREQFEKFEVVINLLSKCCSLFPKRFRIVLLSFYRMKNGYTGFVVRYALLKTLAKDVGKNVSIHPGVYLFHLENLSVGNNVAINSMCYIDAIGGISIGNDVAIAHNVSILSSTHNYEDRNQNIQDQGITKRHVIIQDNVWLGAKATILAGITVGSGSIVGANAVVTKNICNNSIYAGVPACKKKER